MIGSNKGTGESCKLAVAQAGADIIRAPYISDFSSRNSFLTT